MTGTEPMTPKEADDDILADVEAAFKETAGDDALDEPGEDEEAAKQAAADRAELGIEIDEPEPEAKPKPVAKAEEPGKDTPDTEEESEAEQAEPLFSEDEEKALAGITPEARKMIEAKIAASGANSAPAKLGSEIEQAFAPYASVLKDANITVGGVIKDWIGLYEMSTRDPKGYVKTTLDRLGLTFADFADQMPAPEPAKQDDPQVEEEAEEDDPFEDPDARKYRLETKRLAKEIEALKAAQQAPQAQAAPQVDPRLAAERARWETRVEMFKDAKDADGNPAHPHFDQLQREMSIVAANLRESGKPIDLQAVYDMAVKMNPEISAIVEGDKQKKAEAAKRQEQMAALKKAKRASSSIQTDDETIDKPKSIEDEDDIGTVLQRVSRAYGMTG